MKTHRPIVSRRPLDEPNRMRVAAIVIIAPLMSLMIWVAIIYAVSRFV